MALSITMAADVDVDALEGTNIGAMTDLQKDSVGLMAEAYVCNLIRYDAVTNWALIGAIEKVTMTEYVARTIAVASIAWDMSGFTSRIEAENMMNVHLWRMMQCEKLLVDQKTVTFLKAGTP